MAKIRPDLPLISVNMHQQTPIDTWLADVLLANPSVCRILEFKRKRNNSKKEVRKREKLLAFVAKNRGYIPVSEKIHWYVEIDDGTAAEPYFAVETCPYLHFGESRSISLNNFAEQVADEACGDINDNSAAVYHRYLTVLRRVNEEAEIEIPADAESSSSAGSSGGVFTIAIQENGHTRWLAVDNIAHMFMRQPELEQALGIKRALGKEGESVGYKRNLDVGMSL